MGYDCCVVKHSIQNNQDTNKERETGNSGVRYEGACVAGEAKKNVAGVTLDQCGDFDQWTVLLYVNTCHVVNALSLSVYTQHFDALMVGGGLGGCLPGGNVLGRMLLKLKAWSSVFGNSRLG